MLAILIPGLIIVALMVWASTRIKRIAAAAFEPETIETDDFVIQKPEGFLHNLNGDSQYTFEAYSKELGAVATDIRQGRVRLTITDNAKVDQIIGGLSDDGDEIIDDVTEIVGPTRYRLIEAKREENGHDLSVNYKIAEMNSRVFKLETIRLSETSDEFARKIEAFANSFELK
ncbi:MAG TPA: hypothetical protein PLL77_05875 [Pyrinomonadaceae bacterium]|nr:hypothetical protein [Pyrinomonadaceae bacterium]